MELHSHARASRLAIILLAVILVAPAARADCSDGEFTATFLVSGIYEGVAIQIDVVDVAPVGPVTNPSEAEMIAAIRDVIPEFDSYYIDETVGPFHAFWHDPGDLGACAIVDRRDGRVVFAGIVYWSGYGEVRYPLQDSHPWTMGGDPAPEPAETAYLPTYYWGDVWGTPEEITAAALAIMRRTDVLRSFGACDDYGVTMFIYTPTVGGVDPNLAVSVVMVSGRCDAPWNDQPVASQPSTLSSVRWLFH